MPEIVIDIVFFKILNIFDLEAESDSIEINGGSTVHVFESLSERVNSDLLPLLQRLLHILPPDTLDSEVGELQDHVLGVAVQRAHPLLTSFSANLQT